MLSIVVIGRNEAENLHRLIASIDAVKKAMPYPVETIFVDSASTDNSVAIAREYFDNVTALEDSPYLCASAGRFAGTLEASYPWVLYLDGDMEVCTDFHGVLANINDLEPGYVGAIGMYVHRFDNGTEAVQVFGRSEADISANQFGGAVLLNRKAVIEAGNWDPSIFGREEIELYSRLGGGERVVRKFGVPMVNHYSEYYTRLQLILRLLTPSAGMGKVFWGYGQCVRALAFKRQLPALIRLDQGAYLFWLLTIVAIILGIQIGGWLALGFMALMAIFFSTWLRPGTVIRYVTLPLSLFPGWFKYFPWYRPRLLRWGTSETISS